MPAHAESAGRDAAIYVETLAAQAIDTVATPKLSEEERVNRFRDLFVSSFDLPEIGKFVLGRYWRTASESQKREFLKLFEDMTVATWAKRFADYSGETLRVINSSRDGEKGVLVQSQILRENGQPIPVTWRLRQTDQDFMVIDLVVEGVSMALTYRQEFSSIIASNGGDIEALLTAMRKKTGQIQK